ncbi:PREDICTED: uncharacterized protein LOC101300725 isoform X2 [Fragaria vesca subsp. vesca]|uniref:uncharacterized protein LOC101300725 isoform X2 n=1 Tax=Fragaria vesca subsp. vesca TaxID=101020 RepID=UPI0002C376AE|nr:PREDICTED: uncharacterized protein LOC101300725 isoform X2 [Fragaria vesca subsp. vesca]XP_011464689.1 PREDICTED: uncharacterized protein LOC101300725 isoform X2 [Fragaria vesca subsp. vesca]
MEGDSGVDLSSLNLLSDVALLLQSSSSLSLSASHFNPDGKFDRYSCDFLANSATQVLVELKILKKKGLLAVVENKLLIPKKKRSSVMKRKRLCCGFGEDDDLVQRVKRHKTSAAHQLGSSSSSAQLGVALHSQEMKKKINGLIGGGDISLWSFQRKSPLRFSLIKLNVSARTTMVS